MSFAPMVDSEIEPELKHGPEGAQGAQILEEPSFMDEASRRQGTASTDLRPSSTS